MNTDALIALILEKRRTFLKKMANKANKPELIEFVYSDY
jgi:hypothetical protein